MRVNPVSGASQHRLHFFEQVINVHPRPKSSLCNYRLDESPTIESTCTTTDRIGHVFQHLFDQQRTTIAVRIYNGEGLIDTPTSQECWFNLIDKIGAKYEANLLSWTGIAQVCEAIEHGR